jgi:hypothetical protein
VLSVQASLGILLSTALVASPASASRLHRTSTSSHARVSTSSHLYTSATARSHKGRLAAGRRHVLRGQQVIEPARVTEIQQALIREQYLNGDANGQWDTTTQAAMQKYQADQGWQTKLMPDSRALKKLGLGPDYSAAINAKNTSFGEPPPISTIPSHQAAGFAAASGTDH